MMELSILQHTKDNHPQKIGISEVATRFGCSATTKNSVTSQGLPL